MSDDKDSDRIRQIISQPLIGQTGEYPEGKLNASDEGSIQFAVGHDPKGNVVIVFGTAVKSLAMSPQQAADLTALLIKHIREASKGRPINLTLKL